MNPAFPEGYSEWRKVEPRELIDAPLVKEPVQKSVHKALRKQAKDADSVVIATDYDREGELIGLEALEEILDVEPEAAPVRTAPCRRRRQARPLLGAHQGGDRGGLRQPRRAVRAAGPRRRGAPGHRPDLGRDADALRVARDRPPRLAVPVGRPRAEPDARDRRRARARAARARAPSPTGRCSPRSSIPTAQFIAHHKVDKFWEEAEAKAALADTHAARASSSRSSRKRNTRQPPAPFNTTAFTSAASSVGVSPARAMRIAEDLYMDGFISYPRTDNTVYPKSLPVRELLQSISQVDAFKEAAPIAAQRRARADARQEGDHRPPADLPDAGARPERAARRRPPQDLRAGRAALPRDVRRPVGVGVDARRHRGRHRDLLRARQRAGRARLPRGLSIRALQGRGDPEGRGGPGARAARGGASAARLGRGRAAADEPVVRRQGDPAAVADRPGQADRDDGGARPRHEGDAPRHHPEALRPRLHPEQPDRAVARPASRW